MKERATALLGRKPRVLYVDDEKDNLTAFKYMFRRIYELELAQSADQALEFLRTKPFDVIITDQRMPGMTGVEFLEKTLTDHPNTARMILTGYSDIEAVIDAINKGKVYYYFKKPWDEDEVTIVVAHAIEALTLERNLEIHRERLDLAQEAAGMGMFDWDIRNDQALCNERYFQVFGLEPQKRMLSEEDWLRMVHPQDRTRAQREVRDALTGNTAYDTEYRVVWPNQAVKWVCSKAKIFFDNQANPYRMIGTITDITQRKQTEEEVLHLRNFLKNIIDSMPSMLIGVDAQARVTEWNLQAGNLTGIRADQAVGRAAVEVLPGYVFDSSDIAKAIQTQEVQRHEKMPHRRNGQTRYFDVTTYPLVANHVEGAVIRVDDVTDRVRLEEMMVQSEKMATVGGLAAGMAHEINNPLGVIIQGIQTIERRLSGELPANQEAARKHQVALENIRAYLDDREVLNMVNMVKEAGSRAADIIKNMLQFSRRSDGVKTRVRVDELIDRTIALAANDYDLKKRYDFRDIDLDCEYDTALTEIMCVRTEIEQVLLNLLKNAAQAISEVKDLAEPRIKVQARCQGDRAVIEVEDNGPGMAEDVRRRAFEPFFTTKEVGIGTGLGLSVSYMIIANKHQGALTVDSAPGRGARFIVELPIEEQVEPVVA